MALTSQNTDKFGLVRLFSIKQNDLVSFKETEIKELVEEASVMTLLKMGDVSNDFIIHREVVTNFVRDTNSLNNEELRNNFTEQLLNLVSFSNLHKYQTQVDYWDAVNKLMLAERKNDKLARQFETCATFLVLPIPVRKTVVQTILQMFFGRLMASFEIGIKRSLEKIEELRKKEAQILDNDENVPVFPVRQRTNDDVLRYVGGFVVRRLIAKKCPQATIEKLIKEGNERDETESWITKLSRGGLINISDDFFRLLLKIKDISDKHYCIDYKLIRNQPLKLNTTKEVLEDVQISIEWANICTGEDSGKWLKQILDTFLNTRGKCLTKDIKESFQHITNSSIRAKKALRKKLKEMTEHEKLEPKPTSAKKSKNKSESKQKENENPNPPTQSPPRKVRRVNNNKSNSSLDKSLFSHDAGNWDKFLQSDLKSKKMTKSFQGGSIPIFVPTPLSRPSQSRKICSNLKNVTNVSYLKEKNPDNGKIATPKMHEDVDLSFLEGDPDADIFLNYL